MAFTDADKRKIEANKARINDPAVRQVLFKQFAPVFYFSKTESNFPGNIEDYVRNVIEVKHDVYTRIVENHERELTLLEALELEAINDYFWKDGCFNPEYKQYQNEPRFQALAAPHLFIQGVAEYKYRTLTNIQKKQIRELTDEESKELELIKQYCVVEDQFHWVGQMLCGLVHQDRKPTADDLKRYQDSQYFITKEGIFYFSKLDGTLTNMDYIDENGCKQLKRAFPESKPILSNDDIKSIMYLTFHIHRSYENIPDALKVISPVKNSQFLIFDEKHYGYRLGEKIDLLGVAPVGHPEFDALKPQADLSASIIPTAEGYYIQYDYFYPLNGAIPGLQWLRNWSSEAFSKLCKEFGLHYGDSEGVAIHIKVNDEGEASFDFMQTFAHGAKGSRIIQAEDCTFNEKGHVCVYVGEGPHPSYGDNFVGRSKFLDRVGDAYHIEPERFVDVGHDVLAVARKLTDKAGQELPTNELEVDINQRNEIKAVAEQIPAAYSAFERHADSCPLSYCGAQNPTEVVEILGSRNNYKPSLRLTKMWHKLMHHDKGHPPQASYKIPTAKELAEKKTEPPEAEVLSSSQSDYNKIAGKLAVTASSLLQEKAGNETVKDHLKNILREKRLDNLRSALFDPTAKCDQIHTDLLEITTFVNTIRTLFTAEHEQQMADHMIARLTANDMKGHKSIQAMRLVEQTYTQVEHYLESKSKSNMKLASFRAKKDDYRKTMYSTIFALIDKDTKISRNECFNNLSKINKEQLNFLHVEHSPRIRKLLMVMTNAVTLILTAGVANIVNRRLSGHFFFLDRPKSEEKTDDMAHKVSSKITRH